MGHVYITRKGGKLESTPIPTIQLVSAQTEPETEFTNFITVSDITIGRWNDTHTAKDTDGNWRNTAPVLVPENATHVEVNFTNRFTHVQFNSNGIRSHNGFSSQGLDNQATEMARSTWLPKIVGTLITIPESSTPFTIIWNAYTQTAFGDTAVPQSVFETLQYRWKLVVGQVITNFNFTIKNNSVFTQIINYGTDPSNLVNTIILASNETSSELTTSGDKIFFQIEGNPAINSFTAEV